MTISDAAIRLAQQRYAPCADVGRAYRLRAAIVEAVQNRIDGFTRPIEDIGKKKKLHQRFLTSLYDAALREIERDQAPAVTVRHADFKKLRLATKDSSTLILT